MAFWHRFLKRKRDVHGESSVETQPSSSDQPLQEVEGDRVPHVPTGAKKTSGIMIYPVVSEKTARLGSERTYVFSVDPNANKIQIAQAFKELYDVEPTQVHIVNVRSKRVRFGRLEGRRKRWKKAIIQVPRGKEIQLYEGV